MGVAARPFLMQIGKESHHTISRNTHLSMGNQLKIENITIQEIKSQLFKKKKTYKNKKYKNQSLNTITNETILLKASLLNSRDTCRCRRWRLLNLPGRSQLPGGAGPGGFRVIYLYWGQPCTSTLTLTLAPVVCEKGTQNNVFATR